MYRVAESLVGLAKVATVALVAVIAVTAIIATLTPETGDRSMYTAGSWVATAANKLDPHRSAHLTDRQAVLAFGLGAAVVIIIADALILVGSVCLAVAYLITHRR